MNVNDCWSSPLEKSKRNAGKGADADIDTDVDADAGTDLQCGSVVV